MGDAGVSEREYERAMNKAGFWTYRPQRRAHPGQQDQDPWNLFDVLAFHPHTGKFVYGQVKTNQVRFLGNWFHRCRHFDRVPSITCAYAVRYDSKGWKVYEREDSPVGGYTVVCDTRESDERIDEGLTQFTRDHYGGV